MNSPYPCVGSIIATCTAHGNEAAWWANLQVAPLQAARDLWEATLSSGGGAFDPVLPVIREVSQGAASK